MTKAIKLTQGKVALVDAEDYEWLSQWKWHILSTHNTVYARRSLPRVDGKRRKQLMHRLIMGELDGLEVDHIDHDGLNNQRANLRLCNHQEQQHNRQPQKRETSSRFKGVYWAKRAGKWMARIKVNRTYRYLGLFTDEEEAARAYDAAARTYFGEFAYLNFPRDAERGLTTNHTCATIGNSKGDDE